MKASLKVPGDMGTIPICPIQNEMINISCKKHNPAERKTKRVKREGGSTPNSPSWSRQWWHSLARAQQLLHGPLLRKQVQKARSIKTALTAKSQRLERASVRVGVIRRSGDGRNDGGGHGSRRSRRTICRSCGRSVVVRVGAGGVTSSILYITVKETSRIVREGVAAGTSWALWAEL